MTAPIRFVLHRPRNAQNIGACARALANTGAGELWMVELEQYDRAQAARLAAGADAVLDAMQVRRSLDDALVDCVEVVMTTGRAVSGLPPPLHPKEVAQRLLSAPGPVALVFGDEVRGLNDAQLRRATATATIPTAEKASINLAQSALIFAYEIAEARRAGAPVAPARAAAPEDEPAPEQLFGRLRDQARALLSRDGFLSRQEPDRVLEELVRLARRARPTKRELSLLLSALNRLLHAPRGESLPPGAGNSTR